MTPGKQMTTSLSPDTRSILSSLQKTSSGVKPFSTTVGMLYLEPCIYANWVFTIAFGIAPKTPFHTTHVCFCHLRLHRPHESHSSCEKKLHALHITTCCVLCQQNPKVKTNPGKGIPKQFRFIVPKQRAGDHKVSRYRNLFPIHIFT